MRSYWLIKVDRAIYWQKIGVTDEGESLFAAPVVIACRWDQVNTSVTTEDIRDTETSTNDVLPDRVLTIGGFLMLGNESDLNALTEEECTNPKLLRNAHVIKSQSTVPELGWGQHTYEPNYQSEHLTITVQV